MPRPFNASTKALLEAFIDKHKLILLLGGLGFTKLYQRNGTFSRLRRANTFSRECLDHNRLKDNALVITMHLLSHSMRPCTDQS